MGYTFDFKNLELTNNFFFVEYTGKQAGHLMLSDHHHHGICNTRELPMHCRHIYLPLEELYIYLLQFIETMLLVAGVIHHSINDFFMCAGSSILQVVYCQPFRCTCFIPWHSSRGQNWEKRSAPVKTKVLILF